MEYATYYKVTRNDKTLYIGRDAYFVDQNVEPDTQYSYKITARNYAYESGASSLTTTTKPKASLTTLNTYVFSSYQEYDRGSRVYIGVYSRENGNEIVPWARFDIKVTGPNGIVHKTTHYTQADGRYIVSLPTTFDFPQGKYSIDVVMSKQGYSISTKSNHFYLY